MQIEEVILHEPAVRRCAVVGRPNDQRGFLPIAFIELADEKTDKNVVSTRIRRICKSSLKANAQPHELIFVERLPYTRAGKVDYRTIERMAAEGENIDRENDVEGAAIP